MKNEGEKEKEEKVGEKHCITRGKENSPAMRVPGSARSSYWWRYVSQMFKRWDVHTQRVGTGE
jgi:hypothetical protein